LILRSKERRFAVQRAYLEAVERLWPRVGRARPAGREPSFSPSLKFLSFALPCIALTLFLYDREIRLVRWPLEVSGYPAFRDFANLWSGGIAALGGDFASLFDKTLHADELVRLLGLPGTSLVWSYPPTAILPLIPLALLPYAWASAVWSIAGVSAYVFAAGGLGTDKKDGIARLAAAALCPGVFMCLAYGQTALLTSAALVFGLCNAHRRPVIASCCLALLGAKPQIALVVPVMLAGIGAWRTFAGTALLVVAYVGVTLAGFGFEPWRLFFGITLPQQVAILGAPTFNVGMMISPYFMLRGLGLPVASSYVLQLSFSVVVMGWLFVSLRRERDVNIRILMVACAALTASPYMQAYELPLLVLAVARICSSHASCARLGDRWLSAVIACASVATFLAWILMQLLNINFTALIPLALLLGLGCRSMAGSALPDAASPLVRPAA
jgi:hypothetical protein